MQAGVEGIFPTPIDHVAETSGVREILDMEDLPPDLPEVQKPSFLKKLLGALHREERVVWVDHAQPSARVHWTKSHETGHRILPWQQTLAYLDDHERLRFDTSEEFELQANHAAAHLVFQGNRFFERALDYQLSIHTPIALADDFGSSAHATIRYFCERHPEKPVGVAITGRMITPAGRVPIYHLAESPEFRRRYGRLADHLPHDWLPVRSEPGNEDLAKAFHAARAFGPTEFDYALVDRNGENRLMLAEFFDNWRNLFLMLRPRDLVGRRIRAA